MTKDTAFIFMARETTRPHSRRNYTTQNRQNHFVSFRATDGWAKQNHHHGWSWLLSDIVRGTL